MLNQYDIIVVGAGHAGCEAAYSSAKMGNKVLLLTMNMNTIAQMSCNPAMGGVAKGQIIREIDALGGGTGIISDKSAIQFRMLNRSKGPAMWSPRTQNDRQVFSNEWRLLLEQTENIDFWQDMCSGIIVENNVVIGVQTSLGIEIHSKTVILTNGTFLNGLIHLGPEPSPISNPSLVRTDLPLLRAIFEALRPSPERFRGTMPSCILPLRAMSTAL